jgi:CubicO group peptidase (beta-lactamase class C family)
MTRPDSLTRTRALVEQGISEGLHIGAQLYASQNGSPVAEVAMGEARPGVPMSRDTLMVWMSCSKPVTAVAIAQQWERGRLRLDDRIADHVPEFGKNGKEPVTIRHVLTHTAGFRWVILGDPGLTWAQIIARIAEARQERDWVAGRTAGYSPQVSWYLLGEIVRRLDGRDFGRYVREEIFEPLGMRDSWLALPPDRYRAYGDRIGIMQRTDKGPPTDAGMDTEQAAAACRPASGCRGPMPELARFYEMLLAGGTLNGHGIISPQTVEALTARHRVGQHDRTFNHIMDWGLGFLINSAQYGEATAPYGYGPHASPRTYGHGGNQSSVAFADPENGLAAAIVFNGMPGEPAHQRRMRGVMKALYEDLGLPPATPTSSGEPIGS